MSPKEKAKELVEKFIPNVYCYLGSGMLTNEYSEEVALVNAKKQALTCIDEIVNNGNELTYDLLDFYHDENFNNYWYLVREELNKL